MRSLIVGIICLVLGGLGALGYSHFFGEGKQLADLQAQLAKMQADLAKTTTDRAQAAEENKAMSTQIEQLSSSNDDLKKQLAATTNAAPAAPATPAFPFSMPGLAGIMKTQQKQMREQRLQLLTARLHLTPDQVAKVEAALEEQDKNVEAMAAKFMSGQKVDMTAAASQMKDVKSVDQVLDDILTPDQKTAYQQMQADQKNSAAETAASYEMNQVSPLLNLSDAQKDQVETALYQVQLNTQDPNWIKNNMSNVGTNPMAYQDAEEKAKEDALSKILTPDQLATYRQQAQSQMQMQRQIMQNIAPQLQGAMGNQAAGTSAAPTPAPAPASAPAGSP